MSLIANAVALANTLTKNLGLQADVTHASCTSIDGDGTRNFSPPVQRKAIVQKRQRLVRTLTGQMEMSQGSVTFLDPSIKVTMFDKLTLSDGTTGPILNTGGFVDASNAPILGEIFLG